MHINYFRGENRTLAWRRREQPPQNSGWPSPERDFKIRRATCDLEVPRHKRAPRKKPWIVMAHYRDCILKFRRYETEEQAREAIQAIRRSFWTRAPMSVVFKP
jgi:hypothetical protein